MIASRSEMDPSRWERAEHKGAVALGLGAYVKALRAFAFHVATQVPSLEYHQE